MPQRGICYFFNNPHVKLSALYLLHRSGRFLRSDNEKTCADEFPVYMRGMETCDSN